MGALFYPIHNFIFRDTDLHHLTLCVIHTEKAMQCSAQFDFSASDKKIFTGFTGIRSQYIDCIKYIFGLNPCDSQCISILLEVPNVSFYHCATKAIYQRPFNLFITRPLQHEAHTHDRCYYIEYEYNLRSIMNIATDYDVPIQMWKGKNTKNKISFCPKVGLKTIHFPFYPTIFFTLTSHSCSLSISINNSPHVSSHTFFFNRCPASCSIFPPPAFFLLSSLLSIPPSLY